MGGGGGGGATFRSGPSFTRVWYRKFGESCKQMQCFGFTHVHKVETSCSGAEVAKAILTECVNEINQSAKIYDVV